MAGSEKPSSSKTISVPVGVFADDRLSRTDIRVLAAVLTFPVDDSGVCYPDGAVVSRLVRVPSRQVSIALSRLVRFEWLQCVSSEGQENSGGYRFVCREFGDSSLLSPDGVAGRKAHEDPADISRQPAEGTAEIGDLFGFMEANEERAEARTRRFEDWWREYPRGRKRGKAAARRIWKRKRLDKYADELIRILIRQREEDEGWADVRYIPYPATYLNQERWEDEIVSRRAGRKKAGAGMVDLEEMF